MMELPVYHGVSARVEGHALTVHISGRGRLAAILDVIGSARLTLRLFFYIFKDDAVGRKVRDALIAARNRGVAVILMIDGYGSEDTPASAFKALIDAGVRFDRFLPRWGRSYLLRNHQKILLADGHTAIIGGSNIAEIYFADDPQGRSWHDLLLQIDGPSAARLEAYFDDLADWVRSDRPRLRHLTDLLKRTSEDKGALRWLMGGPFRRLSPMVRMLRHDIDRAKSISMIQAYFAPNWGFLRKLGKVAARGTLQIITAGRSDNVTTIGAGRHCYRRLLARGSEIFEYQAQMLHAKLMIIDDAVYIGSSNFDMRSLYLNTEIALRIQDKAFAKKMRALVAEHVPHSLVIDKAQHQRVSTWRSRPVWLVSYFIVATLDFRLARNLNWKR
jgi:cardiolipin synthase A/B